MERRTHGIKADSSYRSAPVLDDAPCQQIHGEPRGDSSVHVKHPQDAALHGGMHGVLLDVVRQALLHTLAGCMYQHDKPCGVTLAHLQLPVDHCRSPVLHAEPLNGLQAHGRHWNTYCMCICCCLLNPSKHHLVLGSLPAHTTFVLLKLSAMKVCRWYLSQPLKERRKP